MKMAIENNSFVTLHRRITQWEWYTDNNVKSLFIHLLLMANHKETKWRGETIGRGQLLTGRLLLSKQTGLSEREIRTAITKLKSTNEITVITTKKYSIITVNNYNIYQDKKKSKRPSKRPSERPTNDQQATTSNNDNNDNNKNKTSSIECVKRYAFTAPTKQETASFFEANGSAIEEAGKYWYHYDANGWMVGKVKMKSWTSAAKKWITNSKTIYLNGNGNAKRNGTLADQQPATIESSDRLKTAIAATIERRRQSLGVSG